MKSLKISIALLVLSVVLALGYIVNNLQTSIEQGATMAFKPIKHGLLARQMQHDMSYGNYAYDIYFPREYMHSYIVPQVSPELGATMTLYSKVLTQAGYLANRRFPVLVFIHGGFFMGGNKKNYAHLCGFAVRNGYICAVPDFPALPGKISRMLGGKKSYTGKTIDDQVKELVKFMANLQESVRKKAEITGIHLAAQGSGAYHALRLAGELPDVQSVLLLNGLWDVTNTDENFSQHYLPLIKESGYVPPSIQPEMFKGRTIRFLLLVSGNEIPYIQEQNSLYFQKFRNLGIPVEIHSIEKESHYSLVFRLGRRYHKATEIAKRFYQ